MSDANRFAVARSLEKSNTGLAAQVARALREYFQGEIKKQQQEITFLEETKKRKFQSLNSATDRATQKTLKGINKFL